MHGNVATVPVPSVACGAFRGPGAWGRGGVHAVENQRGGGARSRTFSFVRAKLTQVGDPAVARPSIAQVNLDVNGRLVRAHVAAEKSMRVRRSTCSWTACGSGSIGWLSIWEARRGGMLSVEQHEWRTEREAVASPAGPPSAGQRAGGSSGTSRLRSPWRRRTRRRSRWTRWTTTSTCSPTPPLAWTWGQSSRPRSPAIGWRIQGCDPEPPNRPGVGVTVSPHAAPCCSSPRLIDSAGTAPEEKGLSVFLRQRRWRWARQRAVSPLRRPLRVDHPSRVTRIKFP